MTATGLALAHLFGDYVAQTNWMAQEKTKRWAPALVHGAAYAACHIPVTRSVPALVIIGGTHAVIDRYRLAKHVAWAKNQIGPKAFRSPHTATGYPDEQPAWLTTWLLFITDNTLHLAINAAAVRWVR